VKSLVISDDKLIWSLKEHERPSATKSNGAAPAHTRSEARRKKGRDTHAAEVLMLRIEAAVSIPSLYLSTCERVTFSFHHNLHRRIRIREKGV
jgi:hypothetical protein